MGAPDQSEKQAGAEHDHRIICRQPRFFAIKGWCALLGKAHTVMEIIEV